MLFEKKKTPDNIASRLLTHTQDYGLANPKGQLFDLKFNAHRVHDDVELSKNMVGQGQKSLGYLTGVSSDGYGSTTPSYGVNVQNMDPKRAREATAENQVHLFWNKNRDRVLKYYRVAGRSEVEEALDQICDEAVYSDDLGEICSLAVDQDSNIGDTVKEKLHSIFRRDVLRKSLNFYKDGWHLEKRLLIEGRIFLEVVFSEADNRIVGINLLPSQNMIVIIQNNLVVGYRQMLEGSYAPTLQTGGKNFIDYSPQQILYADLNMYGPGGINDPRSPLEVAVKPFNQLNTIEDSVTMYRIQWGSERLIFKIDTGDMPPQKAQKHMKDQAKIFNRRIDYNPTTGEVMNNSKVLGLSEHFFMSVNNRSSRSDISRLQSGENLSSIDDLKYFKRNLVNAMKVPPGRITALAGDGTNFSNGKIGEVTQAEVAFARMVQRYQKPWEYIMIRLFIMTLNTKPDFNDDIKCEENFRVIFNRSNQFQNYIDADIINTNLDTFDKMMKSVRTPDNLGGVISVTYAQKIGLRWKDQDIVNNNKWLKEEAESEANKTK